MLRWMPMARFSVVILCLAAAAYACVRDDIPRDASGQACEDPSQCPIVGCDCADNSVVLAQHCISLRCQTSDDACPALCEDRGGWTRRDAGEFFCASDDACPALRCTCVSGETIEKGFCNFGGCAETPGEACWNVCADAGGYACKYPGETCVETKDCCFGRCDGTGLCVDDEGPGR